MISRRKLIGSATAGLFVAPLAGLAEQTAKVWRIGYLSPAQAHNAIDEAFDQSLKNLGYIEGQNLRLERRYTAGRSDKVDSAIAELVGLNADLIVVWSPGLTEAVKNATTTIPVVFLAGGLVVEKGIVSNLARPGGNLTGISDQAAMTLTGKLLQILKELVPELSHAGLLRVPLDSTALPSDMTLAAARSLGIRLSIFPFWSPEDLKGVFADVERERPQGLVVDRSGVLYARRREFIEFAAKNRLPTVYGLREVVTDGGLVSYDSNLPDIAARGAHYVDKILKGMRPGDVPVEQPTKYELVINLKTAKALSLTIPPSLLARADQMIQ